METVECCGVELPTEEALAQHRVKAHAEKMTIGGRCCGIDFYTATGIAEHQRSAHDRRGEPR